MSTSTLMFNINNIWKWLFGIVIVIFVIITIARLYEQFDISQDPPPAPVFDTNWSWDGLIQTLQSETIHHIIQDNPLTIQDQGIVSVGEKEISSFPLDDDFTAWGEYLTDVVSPVLEDAYYNLKNTGRLSHHDVQCIIAIGVSMQVLEKTFKDREYELLETMIDSYLTIKSFYKQIEKHLPKK